MTCPAATVCSTYRYEFPNAGNYIQTFNTDIWVYGMLYESKAPPEFYPLAFGEKANELLQQSFHMFREDITKKTTYNSIWYSF